MNRWAKRLGSLIVWLVVAILAARLIYAVLSTETGGDTLAEHFRNAPLAWLAGYEVELSRREVDEKCRYWLGEVDRVIAKNDNSAEVMLGASILLDNPSFLDEGVGSHISTASINNRCERRCIELVDQAAEIDPENLLVWRTRALLLFDQTNDSRLSDQPWIWWEFESPRDSHWSDVLEEASARDSSNALYDYLAAVTHYWQSAELDASFPRRIMIVTDKDGYNQAVDFFERGLDKPFVLGTAGNDAPLASFLSASQAPRVECVRVAGCRYLRFRTIHVVFTLWNWRMYQADYHLHRSEPEEALSCCRQASKLAEQLTKSQGSDYRYYGLELQARSCRRLIQLQAVYPELFSKRELARLQSQAVACSEKLGSIANNEAILGSIRQPDFARQIDSGLLVTLVLSPLVTLLLLAAVLRIACKQLAASRFRSEPCFGNWRAAGIWVCAVLLSLAIFGLIPTDVISYPMRGWAVQIGVLSATIIALALITLAVLRPTPGSASDGASRAGRQMSMRGMLFLVLGYASVAALWHYLELTEIAFRRLPLDYKLPIREWSGFFPQNAQFYVDWKLPTRPIWRFVLIQWSATLVQCLLHWRQYARSLHGILFESPGNRRAVLRSAGLRIQTAIVMRGC